MKKYQGAFCKVCRKSESQSQTSQGSKCMGHKAILGNRETHIRYGEAGLAGDHERSKNLDAIKISSLYSIPMQTSHSSHDKLP